LSWQNRGRSGVQRSGRGTIHRERAPAVKHTRNRLWTRAQSHALLRP
jgi:hypothetical protein